jgi:Zn-dependent protease
MKVKLLGVEVTFSWSLIGLVALIAWNVSSKMPELIPMTRNESWVCGLVSALLLLGSVLFHEFAHIIVGRRFGVQFSKITLFLLGGAAKMDTEIPSAKSEFWMALAGPASSALLCGVLLPVVRGLQGDFGVWSALALYVCSINGALAAYNMLPLLPMDGGRVLRAGLWALTKNHQRSTNISAYIGKAGAAWFFVSGNLMLWSVKVPLFGSSPLGGVMLMLMSAFLFLAADNEIKQAKLSVTQRTYLRLARKLEEDDDEETFNQMKDVQSTLTHEEQVQLLPFFKAR